MKEYVADSLRELYRLEHLIYVSLKYTRTSDILISIIRRSISFLDLVWIALLEKAKKEKKIEDYGAQPLAAVARVKELYSDERIEAMIAYYLKLRKISKADYISQNEYRRQLTMTVILSQDEVERITIDSVTEDYKSLSAFFSYLRDKYFNI
jgi:hypothetical protein